MVNCVRRVRLKRVELPDGYDGLDNPDNLLMLDTPSDEMIYSENNCENEPSQTVPNASMSLQDIISRVNRGIPMNVPTVPTLFDDDKPQSDQELDDYDSKSQPDLLIAEQEALKNLQKYHDDVRDYQGRLASELEQKQTEQRTSESDVPQQPE